LTPSSPKKSRAWATEVCAGSVKSAATRYAPWEKEYSPMPAPKKKLKDLVILVKGGGEMATGVAHRLARSGFRVCVTEIPEPLAVRRGGAFGEAVFEGQKEVEGLTAKRSAGGEE